LRIVLKDNTSPLRYLPVLIEANKLSESLRRRQFLCNQVRRGAAGIFSIASDASSPWKNVALLLARVPS
jgi:hypothetical protein